MKNIMIKIIVSMVMVAFLTGCASMFSGDDKEKVRVVSLKISSGGDINKNMSEQPSPTIVVLYQLKDVDMFNSADFFNLYQNAKTILNNDLLDQRQIIVIPNQSKDITINLNAETQYLGVLAAFSNLSDATWRQTFKVNDKKKSAATIKLAGSTITIQ